MSKPVRAFCSQITLGSPQKRQYFEGSKGKSDITLSKYFVDLPQMIFQQKINTILSFRLHTYLPLPNNVKLQFKSPIKAVVIFATNYHPLNTHSISIFPLFYLLAYTHQCDSIVRLLLQCLAISNKENLLKSKRSLPK